MKLVIKNILITGGAGYIGSHVAELLIKNTTNKVIILDNLITGHKKLINKKAKFIKADIKNRKRLSTIIKENKIDSIIHLAAHLNVSEAERNKKKYYNNNIIGTKNIIEACNKTNVKNIIFSSSCSIYGNITGAVSERKKPNPQGYYAYTKYKGEELIKKLSLKYKIKYGILRYFNVAGASPSGNIGEIEKSYGHLIKNLAIQSLKKKPQIEIFGNNYSTKDGTCVRDYMHVSDLASIHIKGLDFLEKNKKSFILNCGYGQGYSVKQIIKIFSKMKKNTIIKFKDRRPGDVAQVYANTKKFKKILKWRPKFNNINEIIKSAIKWEISLNKIL
jgi:UDP-glucose 4-epimerase